MAVIPRGAGPTGATGATGAAGPNSITSGTTTTNITGLIRGVGGFTVNVPMIDAAGYTLNNSGGTAVVGWETGALNASDGSGAISWQTRELIKADGATAFNWSSAVAGTLTAFSGVTIAANTLTIGTGAGTVSQTAFAANTFPARASTGNLVAKTVTDAALSVLDDTTVAAMRTTLQITEPTAALVGSYDDLVFPGLAMGGKWVYFYWAPYTSSTIIFYGGVSPSTVGTVLTTGKTSTNYRTLQDRASITGSASAGQTAAVRTASIANCVLRGNSAGQGGWFLKYTFATETAVSGSRFLCGFRAGGGAIASGTEPSTLTDCVFIANDSTDTNLQIMHNDNAGTCTKVDLGSSFPANTANTVFTLYLFAEQNGSAIYYEVRRRDSAAVASGTLSSNLPTATTFMAIHHWGDNNATAAAMILNMIRMELWTKL